MKDLNKLTPTELLVTGNKLQARHDALKNEIDAELNEINKLEISVNQKVLKLQKLEQEYVAIIELITE